MATRPRWLMLSLLPLLAMVFGSIHVDVTHALYFFADRRGASLSVLLAIAFLVGPAITATLFAHPLARLYGRFAEAVAALLGLYAAWTLSEADGSTGIGLGAMALWVGGVAMFATHVCRYWLAGSELAIERVHDAPAATPRWLMLSMLPIATVALYWLEVDIGHGVTDALLKLADGSRPGRRVAALLSRVVIAAVVALVFAYPLARLYGRRAWLVALAMTLPTSFFWTGLAVDAAKSGYWGRVAVALVEVVGLLTLVPLAAGWVQKRLAGSRLVVVGRT
jgi:hypothetical protein